MTEMDLWVRLFVAVVGLFTAAAFLDYAGRAHRRAKRDEKAQLDKQKGDVP